MMTEKKFGDSGSNIIIEEYLYGPEVTVLAFTDGETIIPMISSMDHKRVYDGNLGPNTGGMGVIAPNPYYTDGIAAVCQKTIFLPTIRALKEEGCPFKGCLYFGLMLTKNGPKVIEYNCRFGDPETQAVLPLLETDLLEIMEAVTDEKLSSINIHWKNASCACVVLASGGYPDTYKTGFKIDGLDDISQDDVEIYHAGTEYRDKSYYTAGGRVLGLSCIDSNIESALQKVYKAVNLISFDGKHFRKDIGKY